MQLHCFEEYSMELHSTISKWMSFVLVNRMKRIHKNFVFGEVVNYKMKVHSKSKIISKKLAVMVVKD